MLNEGLSSVLKDTRADKMLAVQESYGNFHDFKNPSESRIGEIWYGCR